MGHCLHTAGETWLIADNAAMIAWTAILRIGQAEQIVSDPPDLPILPKWSLEDLVHGQ